MWDDPVVPEGWPAWYREFLEAHPRPEDDESEDWE